MSLAKEILPYRCHRIVIPPNSSGTGLGITVSRSKPPSRLGRWEQGCRVASVDGDSWASQYGPALGDWIWDTKSLNLLGYDEFLATARDWTSQKIRSLQFGVLRWHESSDADPIESQWTVQSQAVSPLVGPPLHAKSPVAAIAADDEKDDNSVSQTAPTSPPIAEKRDHSYTHHGITISDPYHWLKDQSYPTIDDEDVLDYVKAENAWFEAQMAPFKADTDALFEEMRARIKEDDSSVPQKDGDFRYWVEFEEGAQYRKHYRTPAAGGARRSVLCGCAGRRRPARRRSRPHGVPVRHLDREHLTRRP